MSMFFRGGLAAAALTALAHDLIRGTGLYHKPLFEPLIEDPIQAKRTGSGHFGQYWQDTASRDRRKRAFIEEYNANPMNFLPGHLARPLYNKHCGNPKLMNRLASEALVEWRKRAR